MLLLLLLVIDVGSPVRAAGPNAQALDLITDTAVKICGSVGTGGQTSTTSLSLEAKAELSRLFKSIANLGLSGATKIERSKYFGVLQSDLARALEDNARCRLNVLRELKVALLSAEEPPPPLECFPMAALDEGAANQLLTEEVRRHPKILTGALTAMASSGDLRCVELLLAAGAKPNGTMMVPNGSVADYTPLFGAIQFGNVEIVRKLLRAGANPNLRIVSSNGDGGDPPIVAAAAKSFAIALPLIEFGADVNDVGPDGMSALHWAAKRNDEKLAQALIKAGGRVTGRDRFTNRTPLEWATDTHSSAVENLLAGR